jgi:hypothetical protein
MHDIHRTIFTDMGRCNFIEYAKFVDPSFWRGDDFKVIDVDENTIS